MSESDLYIPDDVLEEATSDIPLALPDGQRTGKSLEPVVLMGSQVNRAGVAGSKLPEGKIVVELSLKTADNASSLNQNKSFRVSFWLNKDSLADKSAMAADKGTKASVRVLKDMVSAYGLTVDGTFLAKFAALTPEMLSGKPLNMKFNISDAKDGGRYFNVNGFAPLS